MCVILSIYQKTPIANQALIDKIKSLEKSNSDGIGIVAFNTKTKTNYIQRNLDIDKIDLSKILSSFDIINIHLRNATAGKISKDNIHFWKYNNWVFSHNGQIFNYEKLKTQCSKEMSDSYIFFEKMIEANYMKNSCAENKVFSYR